jgi:hypothetical protein
VLADRIVLRLKRLDQRLDRRLADRGERLRGAFIAPGGDQGGDGPRVADRSEHARGDLGVGLLAEHCHQRLHGGLADADERVEDAVLGVLLVELHERFDRRRVADSAQGVYRGGPELGLRVGSGAAARWVARSLDRLDKRLHGLRVADPAERRRCRDPHPGVLVLERPHERGDCGTCVLAELAERPGRVVPSGGAVICERGDESLDVAALLGLRHARATAGGHGKKEKDKEPDSDDKAGEPPGSPDALLLGRDGWAQRPQRDPPPVRRR